MTNFPNGYPQNPNQPGRRRPHDLELQGAAARTTRPWRHPHLAGPASPVGRELRPHGDDLGAGGARRLHRDAAPAYAEPSNANREDNIWVFDVRAEKSMTFGSRVRIRAYFDAFNLTNSHASETISRATGLSYLKPSAILAPRTARVGFRFIFYEG